MLFLLQQAVTRRADAHPLELAARYLDQSLTYLELERRSNQLAHTLLEKGVVTGDRVGIYATKSIDTPVAIYGILKAGAAYVPLDPSAPEKRLGKIIKDCGIEVLISQPAKAKPIAAWIAEGLSLRCVIGLETDCRNEGWEAVAGRRDDLPDVQVIEQDLAYVIYTSGSTGTPKGIMHTHRSALAFAEVAAKTYGLVPSDRVSSHAPLHFDLSTLDYFATAVAGAATIIIPEIHTRMPASLSELIEKQCLTVLYTAPLAMVQLCLHGALEKRDLRGLRWMLFGGEPFPTKHLRTLMRQLPHARFSNVYGPTEVNGCTYHLVPPLPHLSPDSPDSDEPLPIGGLFENAEALVVTPEDQILGPGQPGELLIRSGTRMLGYWGQPELTEQSTFRRVRFPGCEDLFHRTGDLVEQLANGDFKFLGRKDRQIKTRGHRVELDEVEAALLVHPEVEEAAVFSVPDGEGSQSIEASVILNGKSPQMPDDLMSTTLKEIPTYAAPVRIEVRQNFPRTATGKTDRRKLREESMKRESHPPDSVGT